MKIKNIFKNLKFYYAVFITVLLTIIIQFISEFVLFPDEIHLIAGIEHNLEFNMPIEATISAIEDDAVVVSVNNEKVEDNINVNLNAPFSIQSSKEGNINMKLSLMGIPLRNVTVSVLPDLRVIPCGRTVGVRIDTDGVMVLGTGSVKGTDKKEYEPCKGILKSGDLILEADGKYIENKESLIESIENCKNTAINLKIKRDDKVENVSVNIIKSSENNKNKIGIWVRDSTQGIGTITYYNPDTSKFGALGHAILDVDTKSIMSVKSGKIMHSDIISIKKGEKGSPGELLGDIKKDDIVGDITVNSEVGIYGNIDLNKIDTSNQKAIPIALQSEIKEGPAKILSNINGNDIEEFDVNIESVNRYNSDDSKGMVVRITDEKLLNKTNGIVQGMSGSPIIQNGKLIGAITHVFIQDPSKGYGIFIENMLKQEKFS